MPTYNFIFEGSKAQTSGQARSETGITNVIAKVVLEPPNLRGTVWQLQDSCNNQSSGIAILAAHQTLVALDYHLDNNMTIMTVIVRPPLDTKQSTAKVLKLARIAKSSSSFRQGLLLQALLLKMWEWLMPNESLISEHHLSVPF